MSYVNFDIPSNKQDLLRSKGGSYEVKDVSGVKSLPTDLKTSRLALKEEGAEYILSNFDTYYSVLDKFGSLAPDIIQAAYTDLHNATLELNKAVGFLLEDKESLSDNEEVKMKYVNIMKMIFYLYTQLISHIEQENIIKHDLIRRKKSQRDECIINKKAVLVAMNNIIQQDISLFWESTVVDGKLINLIAGRCFEFLQNPVIKNEKEEVHLIFSIFGHLIKCYSYGTTFILRITQMIKMYEHLSSCLPTGIKQIIEEYNVKGLLHELIEELTEWQTDEKTQDMQGSRYCSAFLSNLAGLIPNLMMPEVMFLNTYLYHEPPTLRSSVLTVMAEVILNNLSGEDLNNEMLTFRQELFDILIEHINDNAGLVRSKVIQLFARLQQGSAIPLELQNVVLELVVFHLHDKGVVVRKSAANCILTFMTYNFYGKELSLAAAEELLDVKSLKQLKEKLADPKVENLMALQTLWDEKKEELHDFVKKVVEEDEMETDENLELPPVQQFGDKVRESLRNKKYMEALVLCKLARTNINFVNQLRNKSFDDDVQFYMTMLHYLFFDVTGIVKDLQNKEFRAVDNEDVTKLDSLIKDVDVLQHFVKFLRLIDMSLHKMVDLLETNSITDMHEAIDFFINMYKFNIDGADLGISKMLQLMRRNEQERKDAVVKAFQNIYLVTETKNLADHCRIVLGRLIKLLQSLPVTCLDDLQEIVTMWCTSGVLDNALIQLLWRYALKTEDVTDDESIAAIELLRMCAMGRKTIIQPNMEVVVDLVSTTRVKNNFRLLGACYSLLAAAFEPVDISSTKGPLKIPAEDHVFVDLVATLLENVCKKISFYNKALQGAIDFVYKMCERPEMVCEELLKGTLDKFEEIKQKRQKVPIYMLIRLCHMCGLIALNHLLYMDGSVYKELKRQQNLAEKKDQDEKVKEMKKDDKKKSRKQVLSDSASRRSSLLNASLLNRSTSEEAALEGAVAEDTESDFILHMLENKTVTGAGALAKVVPTLVAICEQPALFNDSDLQASAVTAFMRYMLVSSKFCQQYTTLVFTIFNKTQYPEVKTNILLHLSDLLIRYPNIIEPWTPRLFEHLQDPDVNIRRHVFFFMSLLLLKDVIRPHSHIPAMARCLLDEDDEIRGLCRSFFTKLAHKENNLYNALPDIFSHLSTIVQDNDKLHELMKFLFELIDNAKHMENLVERFCGRFKVTEDLREQRNIANCLVFVKYNDRSFKNLIDNFQNYRHIVQDDEVYNTFRTIMQNFTKNQAPGAAAAGGAPKQLVTELEGLINAVFEMDENQVPHMPPPRTPAPKKRTASERKRRKRTQRSQSSDDDSD